MKQLSFLILAILISIVTLHEAAAVSPLAQLSKARARRHQTKVQSGTAGEVEVDIYSGRKNPRWVLSEKETEFLFKLLAGLPPASPVRFDEGLGYRGFVVRKVGTASKLPHEMRVCRGIAYDGTHFYKDAGLRVERWLLSHGRRHLESSAYEYLREEIEVRAR